MKTYTINSLICNAIIIVSTIINCNEFLFSLTETSDVYRQVFDIENRTDMGMSDKRFLFVLNVTGQTQNNLFAM